MTRAHMPGARPVLHPDLHRITLTQLDDDTAYLIEAVGADEWSSMTADVLVGLIDRDRLIAAMAEEYANEQSEDLLRYGWSAQ